MSEQDRNGGHDALVDIDGVEKVFLRGTEEIHVLKDLHLKVPAGEFLALMGPSGSGKSTLLNLIGGLDRPTQGTVRVAGESVDTLSDRHLAAWRARHIGFVFQLYNLLPVLTAERNVELPLLLTHLSKAERRRHVQAALAVVGLEQRAKHFPRQLSGGEQQRVGIARGHRHRSDAAVVRRADGRSRPEGGRRGPRSAAGAQPGAWEDDHHGHP